MRKYQTFNSSCAYAGIANLLSQIDVDVEDRDIIIGSNAAFQLLYDELENQYLAGYKVQGKKWFNYYLNPIGFEYKEFECSIDEYLSLIKGGFQNHMIGLWLGKVERHAVIYEGSNNSHFKYLNNKSIDSSESDYLVLSENDLRRVNKQSLVYGYIEKSDIEYCSFDKSYFEQTIINIEMYKKMILENIGVVKPYSTHLIERNTIYRTLFLDLHSMIEILDHYSLSKKILEMRSKYLNRLKSRNSFALQELCTEHEFNTVLDNFKEIVVDKFVKI